MKAFNLAGLVLALAANVYLAGRIGAQASQYLRYEQEAAVLRAEVARLEALYQAKLRQRDYYRSDAYLEQAARETLGLVGPGEKLIVIPADNRPQSQAAPTRAASTQSQSGSGLLERLAALVVGR
jgi:cell division protein FtsB